MFQKGYNQCVFVFILKLGWGNFFLENFENSKICFFLEQNSWICNVFSEICAIETRCHIYIFYVCFVQQLPCRGLFFRHYNRMHINLLWYFKRNNVLATKNKNYKKILVFRKVFGIVFLRGDEGEITLSIIPHNRGKRRDPPCFGLTKRDY